MAKVYNGSKVKVGNNILTSNQVILGMMIKPDLYRDIKIIRTKDKDVNKLIGAKENATHA